MRTDLADLLAWWDRRASGHIVSAAVLIESGNEGVWDAACYHSHEALATVLKALHSLHDLCQPRTHDLEYLNRLLPEGSRLALQPEELAYLSTYGIERWWEPDCAQARRALDIAQAGVESYQTIVRRHGLAL